MTLHVKFLVDTVVQWLKKKKMSTQILTCDLFSLVRYGLVASWPYNLSSLARYGQAKKLSSQIWSGQIQSSQDGWPYYLATAGLVRQPFPIIWCGWI